MKNVCDGSLDTRSYGIRDLSTGSSNSFRITKTRVLAESREGYFYKADIKLHIADCRVHLFGTTYNSRQNSGERAMCTLFSFL